MKEFDDYDKLFDYLDEAVDDSLEDLAELFRQTLYKFVNENFYGAYEPQLYQRTWDVLNSISVSKKYKEDGMLTVDVFFDISKIHARVSTFYVPENLPRYNHHIDRNGNPVNDIIVFILNEGYHYGKNNNKFRQGGRFLEAMENWSKNKKNWLWKLKILLNSKGIEIE